MNSRVPQVRISDILRGKVLNPQINLLMKLAKALDVTVANLARAYVGIKTHPKRPGCRLFGRELTGTETKKGFVT